MVTPTVFETITDQLETKNLDGLFFAAESSDITRPTNKVSYKSIKSSVGNGTNLLSNHNFLIASPDDSQPSPDATPRSYPPGFQIFSGVFANETIGITNLTYIDGRVSFSGGDFYIPRANSKELENITEFVASVADFDGKPRTRGVSYALVGDEYRVTVGVDALEDEYANETLLGSVKFEQGSVATGHEAGANTKEEGDNRQKETTSLSEITEISGGVDLYPLIGQGVRVSGVGLWVAPDVTADGSPMPNPATLDLTTDGYVVTVNGGTEIALAPWFDRDINIDYYKLPGEAFYNKAIIRASNAALGVGRSEIGLMTPSIYQYQGFTLPTGITLTSNGMKGVMQLVLGGADGDIVELSPNSHLESITFDCVNNVASTPVVRGNLANGCSVKRCDYLRYSGFPIVMVSSTCEIESNYLAECQGSDTLGINVILNGQIARIINNTIDDHNGNAIYVNGDSAVGFREQPSVIQGNVGNRTTNDTGTGQNGNFIAINKGAYIGVIANISNGSTFSGVRANQGKFMSISSNIILDCEDNGIFIEFARENTSVIGNTCAFTPGFVNPGTRLIGIQTANFIGTGGFGAAVIGNNTSGHDFGIVTEGGDTIQSNVIDCKEVGIIAGKSAGCQSLSIDRNFIKDSQATPTMVYGVAMQNHPLTSVQSSNFFDVKVGHNTTENSTVADYGGHTNYALDDGMGNHYLWPEFYAEREDLTTESWNSVNSSFTNATIQVGELLNQQEDYNAVSGRLDAYGYEIEIFGSRFSNSGVGYARFLIWGGTAKAILELKQGVDHGFSLVIFRDGNIDRVYAKTTAGYATSVTVKSRKIGATVTAKNFPGNEPYRCLPNSEVTGVDVTGDYPVTTA